MSSLVSQVEHDLLQAANLSAGKLEQTLHDLMRKRVDFADIYVQSCYQESWLLENSQVKEGHFDVQQGAGVRAIQGEKTGLAYADDLELKAIQQASNAAAAIVRSGHGQQHAVTKVKQASNLYVVDNPINALTPQEKIRVLQEVDAYIRAQDPAVKEVMVSLSGVHEEILVMATDNTLVADIRPLVRCNVTVILEKNGRREQGFAGGGGRYTYQTLMDDDLPMQFAREALRQAQVNLQAIDAPAGAMPVVLGNGWAGVLLHEAVGHGLEGDANRKKSSVFAGRLGERVASSLCTVVDNGAMPGRRGSLQMDDEGTGTQCTTLIENGVLKNYMQDKLNAHLMGMAPTGNGRRESYAHQPIPRMTNTYMLPGKSTPEEIIASIDKGIYAANFGGGQVDTTSGQFVFSISEAYLIEKGKITAPIKGATLIGQGLDILTKVSMVGNDLALDSGVGICGKDGQSVPVGVGQPTLKIDELTVGGTDAG
ncbi:MAG: metalloprotease TldD [Gammaproteobacteria bacterium CG11_big_fil_rev_8_21_14_0_20_46_22]|nr:MAG: metalloprotease TldD [Gammaproteobacteria bacterium CG12_big_fil_rev_8_21_14_0_65_46_12]PIR11615.1 MAG: metalloprotease TldD [Gammaproteobacteria bacterium CG11_big_fil_rev_8_21_14_0_20_46_22]